jgi:hypothetical protein
MKELTAREEKIGKRCAAQYKGFIIRNGHKIGCPGLVVFALGILVLPLFHVSQCLKDVFVTGGFIMIMHAALSDLIVVAGKLYDYHTCNEKSETKESLNKPIEPDRG